MPTPCKSHCGPQMFECIKSSGLDSLGVAIGCEVAAYLPYWHCSQNWWSEKESLGMYPALDKCVMTAEYHLNCDLWGVMWYDAPGSRSQVLDSSIVSRTSNSVEFSIDNIFRSSVMTSIVGHPFHRFFEPYCFWLWGRGNRLWGVRVSCNSFMHYSVVGKKFFLGCLIGLSNLVLYKCRWPNRVRTISSE